MPTDPFTHIVTPSLGVTPTLGGLQLRNRYETIELTYPELEALNTLFAQLQPGDALTLHTRQRGPLHLRHEDGYVQLQARDFLIECPADLAWLPTAFCLLAAYEPTLPCERLVRSQLIRHCARRFQEVQQYRMAGRHPRPEPHRATPEA